VLGASAIALLLAWKAGKAQQDEGYVTQLMRSDGMATTPEPAEASARIPPAVPPAPPLDDSAAETVPHRPSQEHQAQRGQDRLPRTSVVASTGRTLGSRVLGVPLWLLLAWGLLVLVAWQSSWEWGYKWPPRSTVLSQENLSASPTPYPATTKARHPTDGQKAAAERRAKRKTARAQREYERKVGRALREGQQKYAFPAWALLVILPAAFLYYLDAKKRRAEKEAAP